MNFRFQVGTQQENMGNLQKLLQNITYSKLDDNDLLRVASDQHACENFLKLFNISQMSIEYLIYT